MPRYPVVSGSNRNVDCVVNAYSISGRPEVQRPENDHRQRSSSRVVKPTVYERSRKNTRTSDDEDVKEQDDSKFQLGRRPIKGG